MRYWLCLNFRRDVEGDVIANFLDRLDEPWEWAELPASVDKLVIIRCENPEDLERKMRTIPDRNIMTAFGFWQDEQAYHESYVDRFGLAGE